MFAPQAGAPAIKSLHSLLTLNTEYGGKEHCTNNHYNSPKYPPCLRSSRKPHYVCSVFRRRPERKRHFIHSRVTASRRLIVSRQRCLVSNVLATAKTFSCISCFQTSLKALRVSVPPENHTTCAPRFAEGPSDSVHPISPSLQISQYAPQAVGQRVIRQSKCNTKLKRELHLVCLSTYFVIEKFYGLTFPLGLCYYY